MIGLPLPPQAAFPGFYENDVIRALARRYGWWHTGHDEATLLICVDEGLTACMTCLSPEALGGWSPLYVDEDEAA